MSVRGGLGFDLLGDGPHESEQFATKGGGDEERCLAAGHHASVPSAEPGLRGMGDGDDRSGLPDLAATQDAGRRRTMSVGPRCFDQDAAQMSIAGFSATSAAAIISTTLP